MTNTEIVQVISDLTKNQDNKVDFITDIIDQLCKLLQDTYQEEKGECRYAFLKVI